MRPVRWRWGAEWIPAYAERVGRVGGGAAALAGRDAYAGAGDDGEFVGEPGVDLQHVADGDDGVVGGDVNGLRSGFGVGDALGDPGHYVAL